MMAFLTKRKLLGVPLWIWAIGLLYFLLFAAIAVNKQPLKP